MVEIFIDISYNPARIATPVVLPDAQSAANNGRPLRFIKVSTFKITREKAKIALCPSYRKIIRYVQIIARWVRVLDVRYRWYKRMKLDPYNGKVHI